MQVGHHEHTRPETDPVGVRREPRQGDQSIVVGRIAQAIVYVSDVDHVMVDPYRVEPEPLRMNAELDDLMRIGHAEVVGDGESELHRCS